MVAFPLPSEFLKTFFPEQYDPYEIARKIVQEEKMRLGFRTRNLYSADDRKPLETSTSTMTFRFRT